MSKNVAEKDTIKRNLRYIHVVGDKFLLMYKDRQTDITVERSIEGFSHWQKYYVKRNGKIKKEFDTSKIEESLLFGMSLFLEEISDVLLKNDSVEQVKG